MSGIDLDGIESSAVSRQDVSALIAEVRYLRERLNERKRPATDADLAEIDERASRHIKSRNARTVHWLVQTIVDERRQHAEQLAQLQAALMLSEESAASEAFHHPVVDLPSDVEDD
jgi:hypothetical protein